MNTALLSLSALSLMLLPAVVQAAVTPVGWQVPVVASASQVLQQQLSVRFSDVSLKAVGALSSNPCGKAEPTVLDSQVASSTLSVRMAVRTQLQCPGDQRLRTAMTWFSVSVQADVPIARHDLQRDATLQASDLRWEKRDIARFGNDVLDATRLPVRARVPIAAGTLLRASQIEAVPDVLAGSKVAATYSGNGMKLEFLAIAQSDASRGDTVRIERSGAAEPLRARVTGPGTVEVLP